MHRNTKLATCCYCGTRAALVLGEDRHALVCSGCGAPLADLKNFPLEKNKKSSSSKGMPASSGYDDKWHGKKKKSKKKSKPKKSRFQRVFGEILDEIEDIFD